MKRKDSCSQPLLKFAIKVFSVIGVIFVVKISILPVLAIVNSVNKHNF
uniref:Uncharacterized protein n=1 Tax=Rhizophora mucronata TaxID=61149 RepID=A0A2P2INV9_RHIMU